MNKFNKNDKVLAPNPSMVGIVNYVMTIEPPNWQKDGVTTYKYNISFPSIGSQYDFDEKDLKYEH